MIIYLFKKYRKLFYLFINNQIIFILSKIELVFAIPMPIEMLDKLIKVTELFRFFLQTIWHENVRILTIFLYLM